MHKNTVLAPFTAGPPAPPPTPLVQPLKAAPRMLQETLILMPPVPVLPCFSTTSLLASRMGRLKLTDGLVLNTAAAGADDGHLSHGVRWRRASLAGPGLGLPPCIAIGPREGKGQQAHCQALGERVTEAAAVAASESTTDTQGWAGVLIRCPMKQKPARPLCCTVVLLIAPYKHAWARLRTTWLLFFLTPPVGYPPHKWMPEASAPTPTPPSLHSTGSRTPY